ncbi:hypothetical protein B0H11DRAFT_2190978 [Mycena galericulata]|nr:hypothetical protein B0H11DRAFT_2190978 [Mycena galericulata]
MPRITARLSNQPIYFDSPAALCSWKWGWHTELMSMVEQFSDHFPVVENIKFIEQYGIFKTASTRSLADQGKSDQPTSQPAPQPPKQSSSKWTEKDTEWDPADWA